MGLDKETSKMLALQYASEKSAIRLKKPLLGDEKEIDQMILDFLDAYAKCRRVRIEAGSNIFWKEVSDKADSSDQ